MFADIPLPVSEETKQKAEAYKLQGKPIHYPLVSATLYLSSPFIRKYTLEVEQVSGGSGLLYKCY